MKKCLIIMTAVLSFPVLDYAASNFGGSHSDSAMAWAARRSAVAVRGPYGGVAVATRRTAFGRPGYYFVGNSQDMDKNILTAERSDANNSGTALSNESDQKFDEHK